MRQLTLKRKLKFLNYAIDYYSNKDIHYPDGICILFVDEWLKRPLLQYDKTVQIKFPELWTEIERILKKQKFGDVINYKDFYGDRIRLLQRVRKQL